MNLRCRVLFVGLWLGCLSFGSGCGGAAEATVQSRALPPADPKAAKKYLEGARLLARPGNNRDRRAMELFREAIAIDPLLWEAHYNWGVLLRRQGELREALLHFKAAHDTQPAADEPTLALAEVQYSLGEREQATDLLEVYLEAHPDSPGVRIALTAMLRERGMYDDALKQAREALVRNAQDTRALAEVGRIYRAQGDFDVAELVFKKAVDLDAGSAPLQNDLGLVALARGDTQLAFSYFAKATEIDATFTPSRMNRASVLLNAGDYAAAAAEYQSVLASNADDVDARVGLGVALRGQGEPRKAKKEYEQVLEAVPNHPAANLNLAILYAEFLDQRPESRQYFARFLEVATDNDPRRELAERYLREIPAPAPAPAPRTSPAVQSAP